MRALLDSSVLISGLVEEHPSYPASLALFNQSGPHELAVPTHALSETYSQLTRLNGPTPFAFAPEEAVAGIEKILGTAQLLGLTPAHLFDTIRSYARTGGIGPRLYDRLLGEVAVVHSIPTILTLNTRHFRSLFPNLRVSTPAEYLA